MKKIITIIGIILLSMLVSAGPNDPVEFGNLTETTVLIGGSAGLGNFSGVLYAGTYSGLPTYTNLTEANVVSYLPPYTNLTEANVVSYLPPYTNLTEANVVSYLPPYTNLTKEDITDFSFTPNAFNQSTATVIFDGEVYFRDNVTIQSANSGSVNETFIVTDLSGTTKILLNGSGTSIFTNPLTAGTFTATTYVGLPTYTNLTIADISGDGFKITDQELNTSSDVEFAEVTVTDTIQLPSGNSIISNATGVYIIVTV